MFAGTVDSATSESSAFAENIWRSPLVPVALVVTAGIVLDRNFTQPLAVSLLITMAGLLAWFLMRNSSRPGLPLLYLGLAGLGLGAAYHHWHVRDYPPNDIGNFTRETPELVRLRGVFDEEPVLARAEPYDPLRSFTRGESTLAVVRASALLVGNDWRPISGRLRLSVAGPLSHLHVGDTAEFVGWLEKPRGPGNPGEADFAAQLRDQRIRAVLRVRETAEGVIGTERASWLSFGGWLAALRGWALKQLKDSLPNHAGLAAALLLGDSTEMTRAGWEKYIRTGVLHVLAISGQHLVVLAIFLWWILRLCNVRGSRGAWLVGGLLVLYALLAGGRAPVLRAAVMVCVACGALIHRRPMRTANAFALAWLLVIVVNPADIFTPGCQLSFLATAVLYWGASRLYWKQDPLERLVEHSYPVWRQLLLRFGRLVGFAYLANLMIWLAITPLTVGHYHLIPLSALVIGPPLTLLTSVALLTGFLLFPANALAQPLVRLFGHLTSWSLEGCEIIVQFADRPESLRWYVGDVPGWWLWGCYLALLGVLLLRSLHVRWRWLAPAGAAWLCVGLVSGSARPTAAEFRCTFLAVGHGGCTVIETPDGRTLLYDAGAMNGPEVTRWQIAPFLWQRGVRRIDELFLSHADLDHFNGVVELVQRFTVGQVTWTPSFADRNTPGVRAVVADLERRRIPTRVVCAGDVLHAGALTLEVLHPPAAGPEGNENARSLVLLIEHAGHTLLLTGDLEHAGLQRLLGLPPVRVDVLMAPHHGSRAANPPELAAWARPKVVVACQTAPRTTFADEPYLRVGARFLDTWRHGAITIRCRNEEMWVETFRKGERWVLGPGAPR